MVDWTLKQFNLNLTACEQWEQSNRVVTPGASASLSSVPPGHTSTPPAPAVVVSSSTMSSSSSSSAMGVRPTSTTTPSPTSNPPGSAPLPAPSASSSSSPSSVSPSYSRTAYDFFKVGSQMVSRMGTLNFGFRK